MKKFIKKNKFISVLLGIAVILAVVCNVKLPNNKTVTDIIATGGDASISDVLKPPVLPAETEAQTETVNITETTDVSSQISEQTYTGQPYIEINGNVPCFDSLSTESFINLSPLDELGRCQTAYACLSTDTMPAEGEERGEIGQIKPSGWHSVKYDCINGNYLYNRCHMLMWALTSINGDEQNLVTGTRYMNVEMEQHELMIVHYIEQTGNHVMYRVTPDFRGNELVCRGLELQAQSVEDDELSFHVYYFNVQPGIEISYDTGDSYYTGEFLDTESPAVIEQ